MSDVEERNCYNCLGADSQADVVQWVSLCRRNGRLTWVHRACLLRQIQDYQRANNTTLVACPVCLTSYDFTPQMGPVSTALEVFTKYIYPFFKLSACVYVWSLGCVVATIAIGAFGLTQVYDIKMVEGGVITLTVGAELAMILNSLVVINFVPWEEYLLAALRQASRLPVLGCFLPSKELPQYEHPQTLSLSRSLVGCIALPIFANMVGKIFFKSETPNLRRALIGGAAFLAVKCALYMYYRQKLLIRWKEVRMLSFS